MSPTSISPAPVGVTHVRSGWAPRAARPRTSSGVGDPAASSAAANRPCDRALADARRAVEEVGVSRTPPAPLSLPGSLFSFEEAQRG